MNRAFYARGPVYHDGRIITTQNCTCDRNPNGSWRVLIDVPHVAWGERYNTVVMVAVQDDFGTLRGICDDDGKLVLQ